ncbi:aldolase II superfamily protein [compost metagenome]
MLERACTIQIAAQAAGNVELIFPPAEVVAKVEKQAEVFKSGDGPGVARHWDALIRQLERSDSDYKN